METHRPCAGSRVPAHPAVVRKGDFFVTVQCRGELRARTTRMCQIVAPVNVPDLRIVWMATRSKRVKEGDPVVRFDPSSAKQQLQEKEATAPTDGSAAPRRPKPSRGYLGEDDKRELNESGYQSGARQDRGDPGRG